jgi:hypothetical protein
VITKKIFPDRTGPTSDPSEHIFDNHYILADTIDFLLLKKSGVLIGGLLVGGFA